MISVKKKLIFRSLKGRCCDNQFLLVLSTQFGSGNSRQKALAWAGVVMHGCRWTHAGGWWAAQHGGLTSGFAVHSSSAHALMDAVRITKSHEYGYYIIIIGFAYYLLSGSSILPLCDDITSHRHYHHFHLLAVPRFPLKTYGRRAFSVAGPMACNSIPDFIRDPTSSTYCFRGLLKTYLFARC